MFYFFRVFGITDLSAVGGIMTLSAVGRILVAVLKNISCSTALILFVRISWESRVLDGGETLPLPLVMDTGGGMVIFPSPLRLL